jgi:nucleoside-diphosphate-sugar epimerase
VPSWSWDGAGLSDSAAQACRARIFFPGAVYNFGPDAFPLLAEDAPQRPQTRKGAIRVEMETSLRAAAEQGVRVLILRAGDWFGPVTVRPPPRSARCVSA